MKIIKPNTYLLSLLICIEINYAQDFKIAPNTSLHAGSEFFGVSTAADINNGFLVTWINCYTEGAYRYLHNYACRITKNGEMLDSTAIFLCNATWENYCTSAVFAGGNWIITTNQGGLYEYVGAVRLTATGEVLDDPPVNICNSIELATLEYPTIATNGEKILCVIGVAGCGLYGSIIDTELNILVDQFPIRECNGTGPSICPDISLPRVTSNGENFFITFKDGEYINSKPYYHLKLVVLNPEGEILSIQKVNDEECGGPPMITTLNNITYVSYFLITDVTNTQIALFTKRYSADGKPLDSCTIKVTETNDYPSASSGYHDLVNVEDYFYYFYHYFYFYGEDIFDTGISLLDFKSDLSTICKNPISINSQCHLTGLSPYGRDSRTEIRASAIEDNVLLAWLDKREDSIRIYGNFFNINQYVGIEKKDDIISKEYLLYQNYPNPFNPSTTIGYQLAEGRKVTLKVYDVLGKEIVTLVDEYKPQGRYETEFSAAKHPSGVYFYQLRAGKYVETRKMVLMK